MEIQRMEPKSSIPFKDRYDAILTAYNYSPGELAEKLKKPFGPFYKYRTGEIEQPRKPVLEGILSVFPDLSRDYLYKGVGPMKQSALNPPNNKANEERLQKEIDRLNKLLIERDKKIDTLEKQIEGYLEDFRKMALNFPVSGSQTTAYQQIEQPRMVVSGFRQKQALLLPPAPLNLLSKLNLIQTTAGVWYYPGK